MTISNTNAAARRSCVDVYTSLSWRAGCIGRTFARRLIFFLDVPLRLCCRLIWPDESTVTPIRSARLQLDPVIPVFFY